MASFQNQNESEPQEAPPNIAERRRFCEEMKTMTKSEFIEIARILRSHGVTISENRNGLFFNMATVPEKAFQELIKFREFVTESTNELAARETAIQWLKEANNKHFNKNV